MNNSAEIGVLRTAIQIDSKPMAERRTAAAHLVKLSLDSMPAPDDDDPAVVKLMKPWPRTTDLERQLVALATDPAWCVDGRSLAQAKAIALKNLRRARLTELIDSPNEHTLVREAARFMRDAASTVIRHR